MKQGQKIVLRGEADQLPGTIPFLDSVTMEGRGAPEPLIPKRAPSLPGAGPVRPGGDRLGRAEAALAVGVRQPCDAVSRIGRHQHVEVAVAVQVDLCVIIY